MCFLQTLSFWLDKTLTDGLAWCGLLLLFLVVTPTLYYAEILFTFVLQMFNLRDIKSIKRINMIKKYDLIYENWIDLLIHQIN